MASRGQTCGQDLRPLAAQAGAEGVCPSLGVCGCIYQAPTGSLPTSRADVWASCGCYSRISQTSGLKQHKCILLQFWSPKSKPLAGLVLSRGFMETRVLAFLASRRHLHPWLLALPDIALTSAPIQTLPTCPLL